MCSPSSCCTTEALPGGVGSARSRQASTNRLVSAAVGGLHKTLEKSRNPNRARAHLLDVQPEQLLHDGRLAGRRGQRAVEAGQQRVDRLERRRHRRVLRVRALQRRAQRLARLRRRRACAARGVRLRAMGFVRVDF